MTGSDIILIGSGTSKAIREASRESYPFPPVGMLSLAAYLKVHGYRVHIVDLYAEDYSRKQFKKRLRQLSESPLAVGISFYTECYQETVGIAKLCREVYPETKLIAGGPHVTFQPEELLSGSPVDFAVRHEGESTLVELLEHIRHPDAYPADLIPSITYRDGEGAVVSTEGRPFITNLDALPFPDYELLESHKSYFKSRLAVNGSRGCPGDCIYCSSRAFSGRRYRFHSAEWLFSLLYEYQLRYEKSSFALLDDTFTVDRKRARKFCWLLRERWPSKQRPSWSCRSRADCVVDEICSEISRSGCMSVHIGVESGDQDVLVQIGKRVDLEKMLEAVICGLSHELSMECSFILGHHCDTLETIEKTIILAKAIDTLDNAFSVLALSTPFPGTRLFEEASELGVDIVTKNWSKYDFNTPIYGSQTFTTNDLRRALLVANDPTVGWDDPIGLTDHDHQEFRERIQRMLDECKRVTAAADSTTQGEA